jgi:hypothetical protein
MALFVDGPAAGVDDLTNQDSGMLDVAQTCGIDVTTKLTLAHEEIAADLQLWLERPRPAFDAIWRPLLRIEQIVITPTLKRWEVMQALSLFYRDAYFAQLADRYQKTWDEYSSLTRLAYEKFLASGMALVNDPVHQAAPPALSSVPGPQKGGAFYARIAWVNAAGKEGAASVASSISIPDNNLMVVSAAPATAPNVAGFNVYAGSVLDALVLQNNAVLPLGSSFEYVPGFAVNGRAPGTGQAPDFIRPLNRTLLRG